MSVARELRRQAAPLRATMLATFGGFIGNATPADMGFKIATNLIALVLMALLARKVAALH